MEINTETTKEELGLRSSVSVRSRDTQCAKAAGKDVLIAEMIYESWKAKYSLTRLIAESSGFVVGPDLPAELAGHLDIINTVSEARESVARALKKVSGLPPYGILGVGRDGDGCDSVAAWAPAGNPRVKTGSYWLHTDGENEGSWRITLREFGRECPLLRTIGNRDIVDIPGNGSTDEALSATVRADGIRASAWGLCPIGTSIRAHCKLNDALGIHYKGRWCQYYYGSLRCVLK